MQTQFDVVIVGAGPAGSTAAILLARAGWSVALVEKHVFPRRKVCGECIAASNWMLFDRLGLYRAVAQRAGPDLRKVALMVGAQTVTADLPPLSDSRYAWGRALGRESLDPLLLEEAQASGATVFQPWSVTALEGGAGEFHCAVRSVTLQDELTLQAPIAIAAHGSWESLHARRRVRRSSDLFAFKANFRNTLLPAGVLPVLSFEGGYGGMVIADGGMATLACCIRADRLRHLRRTRPDQSAGEVVGEMLERECSGVASTLQGAQRVGEWLACGPLDPGIHLRRHDEVFRIGNAAGEAHPIIGEGMSMAMQSAWLLCAGLLEDPHRNLRQCAWQQRVRARYVAEWRHQFTPRLRLAALFAQVAMRPRLLAPLLPLLNRARLLTYGARWSGKARSAVDPDAAAWLADPPRAHRHI